MKMHGAYLLLSAASAQLSQMEFQALVTGTLLTTLVRGTCTRLRAFFARTQPHGRDRGLAETLHFSLKMRC